MNAEKAVWIDVLPQGVYRHAECDALVFLDVILTATTAVTALAKGRRAFFAGSAAEARDLAEGMPGAILAQEDLASDPGVDPVGPRAVADHQGAGGPLILVSTWTHLLADAARHAAVYVTSLRNLMATAQALEASHSRVALLGAGFGEEQRSEDRIAAATLAQRLVERGFDFGDLGTAQEMQSWADADPALLSWGRSAEYLRRVGRDEDLEFVLSHRDDLDLFCRYEDGELVRADPWTRPSQAAGVAPGARFPRLAVAAASGTRQLSLAPAPVAQVPK
jgi:phosphosulfolactate phosphohydrolase-like enzyme